MAFQKICFLFIAVFLSANLFFTVYLYYHANNTTMNSAVPLNELSIVSFATNNAELYWFQHYYAKHIEKIPKLERPTTHVTTCIKSDPSPSEDIIFHYSEKCFIPTLYRIGVENVNSRWTLLLEPGFIPVKDMALFLTKVSMKQNTIVMVVTLESALINGKLYQPTEDWRDMLEKVKAEKLRPYLHHRRFTSFLISHYVLPALDDNSKKTQPDLTLPWSTPIPPPEHFHFLTPFEMKSRVMEIMVDIEQTYSHERISSAENVRSRVIRGLKNVVVTILTEKIILHHHKPLTKGMTLAVHLSLDRLESLKKTLSRWNGKFVAIFNVNSKYECDQIPNYERAMCFVNDNQPKPKQRTFDMSDPYHRLGTSYPVNTLRNAAISLVETELMFLIDADFCPDSQLSQFLNHDIENMVLNDMEWSGPKSNEKIYDFLQSRNVFVIPAFDLVGDAVLPTNKPELLSLIKSGASFPILSKPDQLPEAHSAVNYQKFYDSKQIYEITYKYPFEPYVVGATNQMPMFDERFNYYGNDKVWNHFLMNLMGFKYFVAPNHFLIHLKHAEGTWSKTERNTAAALIVKYNSDFKKELRILFGSSPGSPIIL